MDEGYTQTLFGLRRKREELCREVAGLQTRMEALLAQLDHVDATIRVFDPNADVDGLPNRPPPRLAAFRGEMSRAILDIMRASGAPMTTGEVGERMVALRGLDTQDRAACVLMTRRCGMALKKMSNRGLVAGKPVRAGGMMRWGLVG